MPNKSAKEASSSKTEPLSQLNVERYKRVVEKFKKVGQLEQEVAKFGVNFTVRGQEKLQDPEQLKDLEAAADDVIESLDFARRPQNSIEELRKRAIG